MLENQTPEAFQDVSKPKYSGTLNLDRWAARPPLPTPGSPGAGRSLCWRLSGGSREVGGLNRRAAGAASPWE